MFYLDLLSALERHRVRYLLVGGLAMNLHGVPRMTMDVDIMLALDGANLGHFILLADELGLRPTLPIALDELGDAGKRASWVKERHMVAFPLRSPENSAPTVDVLIGADLPFDEAYGRRLVREVGGIPVSLAAVEDMIALKEQAGRAQDLADIEHLKRLGHG
ncbi:MAG: nucleotidyl transferase AbiEii/AbiGii toxin family protein [Sulfuricellaceae bacterium]